MGKKDKRNTAPQAGSPEIFEEMIRSMIAHGAGRNLTQRQLKAVAEGLEPFLMPSIQSAIDKAVQAVYVKERKEVKDTYKDTERRLYALPILRVRLENKQREVIQIALGDLPEKSTSVVRFQRHGVRMDEDDIIDAIQQNLAADIAAVEHEIEEMEAALQLIRDDEYFLAVEGKYISGLDDAAIAEKCTCDPSTVRRNRGRLIRKMAIWLYGVAAI